MLDAMRRGVANFLVKVLLGLLIIAFAFWGVPEYFTRNPFKSDALATVGSTQITVKEFQQAYKDEIQAIARKLGRTLTPEQAQILGLPPRTLARLIGTAAIDLHAKNLGVTISDAITANIITSDPAFKGVDDKFSRTEFRKSLAERGYRSEQDYIAASKRDLIRQQLTETLGAGMAPQAFLVDAMHRFRNETRVIEHLTPDFSKQVTVADPPEDKLKEFFDKNKSNYIAHEERKANLLLLSREAALSRIKVTGEEVKSAYDGAKESYNVPEKRRVSQLTFADKAKAEKAYAELSKAKNFDEAAAKLGFPAADIQLGVLTKAEMIDPKIAEAAFKLKKDELSPPVEGQFSVVLLRVTEIEPGKQRGFDEVKGEIRDRIANERLSQQLQSLYEKIDAGRAKGTPLKEISEELKLPYQEIAAINRLGKTNDDKAPIAHADAGKIAEAIFGATPGVDTEPMELSDNGFAWFDLIAVTPERQKTFEEVKGDVKAHFIEAERRKEIASLVAKQIEGLQPGEGLEKIAKALGGKVQRTAPVKRNVSPPPAGLTAVMLQQAFSQAKGGVSSAPSADGKSRTIFRVADVIAAPAATETETASLKDDIAKQMRIDTLDQYVAGLRTRYGFTVNEKLVLEALGAQSTDQPDSGSDN